MVAAAGTTRGEVAEGAAAACRSEVAGGACWHALRQAKEITLVVAAAADYRHTCGRQRAAARPRGARGWHALCQAKETDPVVAAAAGYSYLTGGRGGGRLPAYLRLSKHLMQTVDFLF